MRSLIVAVALLTGCAHTPWCLDHVETFSAGSFKHGGHVTAGVALHWYQTECPTVAPVRSEP